MSPGTHTHDGRDAWHHGDDDDDGGGICQRLIELRYPSPFGFQLLGRPPPAPPDLT